MKRNATGSVSPSKHTDAALDEGLAESFPASDPVAISFPAAVDSKPISTLHDLAGEERKKREARETRETRETREIELKLQIPRITPARFFKLLPHKKYVTDKAHTKTIISTYYDTPDFALKKHDISLRVRHMDGKWVQTFKSINDAQAGLFQRDESSAPLESAHLDIDALHRMIRRKKRWATWPDDIKNLEPIFITTVKRTIWNLQMDGGHKIELAFDQGTITRDGQTALISEVELELKEGSPRCLFDVALSLSEVFNVSLSKASKCARGYTLCEPPKPAQPANAGKSHLRKHMTVEESFEAIVNDCMQQIQGNEASVIESVDPEGIHQMRVGLRRLQSCLKLFEKLIALPADLQGELDWLSSVLGPARDWEVLCGATLPSIDSACPGNKELQAVKKLATAIAVKKREQAGMAVQSARYTRLLLNLRCWMEEKSWRDDAKKNQGRKLDKHLEDFSEKHLKRDSHRLVRRSGKLDNAVPTTIHKLRIAVKKARYTAEFFRSLFSGKQVGRYINKLATVQDKLGEINDATVADRLLQEIAESRKGAEADVDLVRGFLVANAHSLQTKGVKRLEHLIVPTLK